MDDDPDLDRARIARAVRDRSVPSIAIPPGAAVAARVISTSPNLGVGKFLKAIPQAVLGNLAEGASAVYADLGSTPIFVRQVGPGVPAGGDKILAERVKHRWIQQTRPNGGADVGTLLGCVCAHPKKTLTMTVGGSCSDGRFYDCTIQYGPTPAPLAGLQLGANCYLSTTTFPDPQTGDLFYYYLSCFSSVVRLSRVFPTSIYGSPFLDFVIYFWTLGYPGNTCDPFLLSNGAVFAGGDPACAVVISG